MPEAQKTPFDPQNPEHVTALQARLNRLGGLEGKSEKLQLTGEMDAPTKAAWLAFKKDTFADSSLSLGYLKDPQPRGLAFTDAQLKVLGVDPSIPPGQPGSYDRNTPPEALVKVVQSKLSQEHTGVLDEETKAIIRQDKQDHWIDDRTNPGALDQLDKEIKSREAAQGVSMSGVGLASGEALASLPVARGGAERTV